MERFGGLGLLLHNPGILNRWFLSLISTLFSQFSIYNLLQ